MKWRPERVRGEQGRRITIECVAQCDVVVKPTFPQLAPVQERKYQGWTDGAEVECNFQRSANVPQVRHAGADVRFQELTAARQTATESALGSRAHSAGAVSGP